MMAGCDLLLHLLRRSNDCLDRRGSHRSADRRILNMYCQARRRKGGKDIAFRR
jgi:hypothetical protein